MNTVWHMASLPKTVAASEFWARSWAIAVRDPVAPRDLQVIDEDRNEKKGKGRCLL